MNKKGKLNEEIDINDNGIYNQTLHAGINLNAIEYIQMAEEGQDIERLLRTHVNLILKGYRDILVLDKKSLITDADEETLMQTLRILKRTSRAFSKIAKEIENE